MRRFGIVFILALLGIGLCQAENLDIRSLHTLSNTMDHNEFLQLAIQHDSLTRSITTQQWYDELGLISDDTLSMRLMPTLYDLIANDYCLRGLSNHDSIAQAWLAFHAKDTTTLPRQYITVNIRHQSKTDSLLSYYASLPDTWERGFVLSGITDYSNQLFYHYTTDYLQQHSTSPFSPNIRYAKQRCEQISIYYSYPTRLHSFDSLTISYHNTNAREIVFELYRVPDKMPNNGKIGAALVKVDSVRVNTMMPLIFEQSEMQCRMAPQPYGVYFIYPRLPEDSLQIPIDSLDVPQIKNKTIHVSDLHCFNLKEIQLAGSKPWVVVTDARTGQPVQNVKVKRKGSVAYHTNRNGETVFTNNKRYVHTYQLSLGADKYLRPRFYDYDYNYLDDGDLCLLPNATIFRPNDTLKLAIVAQKRHKYKTSLLVNTPVKISLNNARYGSKDTILTLGNYASAVLAFPFTDDMSRGQYFIRADVLGKKGKHINLAYCSVHFEDYRLPSFNLTFDDSCHTMSKERIKPITGKVIRSNGMPMVGASVAATLILYPSYANHTLKALSDDKGFFRLIVPDSLHAHFRDCNHFLVRASVTSPDGEKRGAYMSVFLSYDTPEENIRMDSIAGVPHDSLLWLPRDSTSISGSKVTMRLGVPRTSWVYCVASSRSKLLSHKWKQLSPGMHTFSFVLPDKKDDYLDVRFITSRMDGTYEERHRHFPGTSSTELHITPITMRDYLTPEARETWTFRLTDAQGLPAQARMVLAMNDKSIESLQSSLWSEWSNSNLSRWVYPYTQINQPQYPDMNEDVKSIIRTSNRTYIYPPLLYEPYRVDSGLLMVVKGKVVDALGEPLIGVAISEKGSTKGTITDYDGCFTMSVRRNTALICSFVGMQTIECAARSSMYIVMSENVDALNEVVVTGYGAKHTDSGIRIRGIGSIRSSNSRSKMFEEDDVLEVATLGMVEEEEPVTTSSPAPVTLRQGDTRLALYLPDLQTDSAGEVHVHFLTPPDNTEWLMQAAAWSINAATDYMTRTFIARRTLMLRLQLPRFMRHGDELSLPCVISNTADTARQTIVSIQIRDAATDSLLTTHTFTPRLSASASETLFFPYKATNNGDIIVRAEVHDHSGSSDGEQRLLHILPIIEPVSESVPFYLHAGDSAITLCTNAPANVENRKVTLMLCNNPLAYIAAGLPQNIDSSAVTVTTLSHNLYALALRNRLAQTYPSLIKPVDISYLVRELKHYQRGTGAFSWLKNNHSTASFYLTLRVLALLGELQEADALDRDLTYMKQRAVRSIDSEVVQQEKYYRKAHHDSLPDYTDYVMYAYVRAIFDDKQSDDVRRIFSATLDSLYTSLNTSELTEWPLLALMFERAGQHDRALTIVNGLRRYATLDDAHGMYWNNLPDRWWWYRQADIQASFLLAFSKIDPQQHEMDAMRQWLILNNRTTEWGTSSLNAYVIYVLMHTLPSSAIPNDSASLQYVQLPDTTVRYTLRHETGTPAWGALMTSFSAPANMLKPFSTSAMKIERIFERIDAKDSSLSKGDRVRVKLRITTDREMDNVIITDHRSALLEPMGMSDFGWENGALYYREIRNAEQIFYVEHLQRGITVLTYDCYVTASGTTLAGLATATSELAPEFTTHTGSTLLKAQ